MSRPYPFFLAYPLEGAPDARRPCRVAGGMEVGRHPRAAHPPRRADLSLVPRRGAGDRALPRARGSRRACCPTGRSSTARSSPGRTERRCPSPSSSGGSAARRSEKILAEVPVVLVAYDLLEDGGEDVRDAPLEERRARLAELVGRAPTGGRLLLSPLVAGRDLGRARRARAERAATRAEGLMLKRLGSRLRRRPPAGRLVEVEDRAATPSTPCSSPPSAAAASGRASTPTTPSASGTGASSCRSPRRTRASPTRRSAGSTPSSGATWSRSSARCAPSSPSSSSSWPSRASSARTRHKSGIAVRFPRMARWRTDKKAEEADTIETVRALLSRRAAIEPLTSDHAEVHLRTCGIQYAERRSPPSAAPSARTSASTSAGGAELDHAEQMRGQPPKSARCRGPGLISIGTDPKFAIGQRALHLRTAEGNVLWDCISLVDDRSVDAMQARSAAFGHRDLPSPLLLLDGRVEPGLGDVPVYLHAADGEWVMRPIRPSSSGRATPTRSRPELTLIRLRRPLSRGHRAALGRRSRTGAAPSSPATSSRSARTGRR